MEETDYGNEKYTLNRVLFIINLKIIVYKKYTIQYNINKKKGGINMKVIAKTDSGVIL